MSLTNFPNGITSFGVPVMGGGGIPATFGNVYFVDYRNGADTNDGKSPTFAKKTLAGAYAVCTSNNNDLILVDGDSATVETAMITWSKNRIHVIGCNGPPSIRGYGQGARITMGVTGVASNTCILKVTGVRNTFTALKFDNGDTTATNLYTVIEAGEYTRYNFCEFYKGQLLTTAGTAEVVMNGDSSQFYGCTFGDLVNERGASGKQRPNVLLTREVETGKVCRDGSFVDCRFLHKAAHADACFMYGVGATSVERSLEVIRPIFWNCVLATADPADAINFNTAQTDGDVLVSYPSAVNVTAIGGASLNIYVVGPVIAATDTVGIGLEVSS